MSGGVRGVAKRIIGVLVALALVAVVVVAAIYRQAIIDSVRANNYDAPEGISAIVDDLGLTSTGERVFLATHPTLDGSQTFNEHCQAVGRAEGGHVLGCFTDDVIHLFEVTDERISGVVEVTAAHELLHAAWSRMGTRERSELSERLEQTFEELADDDPALAERMEVYEHLSDEAYTNELHSVLGTEVRELPDWLEEHFARWFEDRDGVVDDFDAYHSVFIDLQDQADALQEELTGIREDVERRNAEYESSVERFNDDAEGFKSRNESYEFSEDPDEFERIRADLEGRRAALEEERLSIQDQIARYEDLRQQLLSLNQVSDELDQHLNSDLAPPATRPDG